MENIKRKIKIFWVEHNGPIVFYTAVIAIVILVVQTLNQIAIQKNKKNENNSNSSYNQKIKEYEEDENSTSLVNNFINFCKNGDIEKAYNLLSKDCKENLYPTEEEFTNKYYNKIFKQKRSIEIKYDDTKNVYKIIFNEDILELGRVDDINKIEDYYKIKEDVLGNKTIYINLYNSI